jgi:hypothetical protein
MSIARRLSSELPWSHDLASEGDFCYLAIRNITRVVLDWKRLSLSQRGKDTNRIDTIYKIHYLQWTGLESLDKVLGAIGILLTLALSVLGARLLLK